MVTLTIKQYISEGQYERTEINYMSVKYRL